MTLPPEETEAVAEPAKTAPVVPIPVAPVKSEPVASPASEPVPPPKSEPATPKPAPVAAPAPQREKVTAPVPPPSRTIPPPPRSAQTGAPPQKSSGNWWVLPVVIVGLIVIAWVLLAVLPFNKDEPSLARRPADETVTEGSAPPAAPTATITEVGPGEALPGVTQTTAPPSIATQTAMPGQTMSGQMPPAQMPPPMTSASSPAGQPVPVQTVPAPTPKPAATKPAPAPAPRQTADRDGGPSSRGREISDAEAVQSLSRYIASRNYYRRVTDDCLEIRSIGYSNEGYAFVVWNACDPNGGSRMLGRWRVDAKNGSVYVRNDSGRYVSP